MRTAAVILFFLVAGGAIFYLNSLGNTIDRLEYENELKQATIDSIKAVKAQPPDTIVKDTTIFSIKQITFSSDFDSLPDPENYQVYNDSIVNDSIRVWAEIKANELYKIDWTYEPVIHKRTETINKPYPVIVPEYIDREVIQNGIYLTGGFGFGDQFTGNAGIIYLTKKGYFAGTELIQVGNNTMIGLKAGVKIW